MGDFFLESWGDLSIVGKSSIPVTQPKHDMKKYTSEDIANGDCIMIPASLVKGFYEASGRELSQEEVAEYVWDLIHSYMEVNGYID
jgi:hypothetical protein